MPHDIVIDGKPFRVDLDLTPITVNGAPLAADLEQIAANELSLIVNGRVYRCLLDRTPTETAIIMAGRRYAFTVEDPRALKSRKRRGASGDGPLSIKSAMPGRILRVLASEGDVVASGQGLLVVEAMKMQNEMKSPRVGRVRRIAVQEGETVNAGQLLAIIE